ncbi:MAG: hypothetical protein ACU84Q_16085 [Gammaproteobacteria bacterium]
MDAVNWEAISAIAEVVGVLGLIGSLVYLAIQVNLNSAEISLNTETAKVAAYHEAIDQIKASWMEPEFADLSVRYSQDPSKLTEAELFRLEVLWSATLFGHEVTLDLYRKGLIDPDLWENMLENNRAMLSQGLPLELLSRRPGPLSRRLHQELVGPSAEYVPPNKSLETDT